MPDCKTETVGYFLRSPGYSGDNSKTGVQKYRNEHPDEATNGSKIGLWTLLAGLGVGAIGGIGYKTSDGSKSWGTVGVLGALAALAGAGLKIYSYTSALVPETSDASKTNKDQGSSEPDTAKRHRKIQDLYNDVFKSNYDSALSRLKSETDKTIIDEVSKLLIAEVQTGSNEDHKKKAIFILGELKIQEAVEPLLEVILSDKLHTLYIESIDALGKIGNKKAIPGLVTYLKKEQRYPYLGTYACYAIGKMGGDEAYKELVELSKNDDEDIRQNAVLGLCKIKDFDVVKPIMESLSFSLDSLNEEIVVKRLSKEENLDSYLTNASSNIRAGAARILGVRKEIDKTDKLVANLDDTDLIVRTEAARALCDIYSDYEKVDSLEKAKKAKEIFDFLHSKKEDYFSPSIDISLSRLIILCHETDPAFKEKVTSAVSNNISKEDFLEQYKNQEQSITLNALLWLDSIYKSKKQKDGALSEPETRESQFVKECLISYGKMAAQNMTAKEFQAFYGASENPLIRKWAITTLEQQPSSFLHPDVKNALGDLKSSDINVRSSAIATISRANHPSAIPHLAKVLEDENFIVAVRAVEPLITLAAVDILEQSLLNKKCSFPVRYLIFTSFTSHNIDTGAEATLFHLGEVTKLDNPDDLRGINKTKVFCSQAALKLCANANWTDDQKNNLRTSVKTALENVPTFRLAAHVADIDEHSKKIYAGEEIAQDILNNKIKQLKEKFISGNEQDRNLAAEELENLCRNKNLNPIVSETIAFFIVKANGQDIEVAKRAIVSLGTIISINDSYTHEIKPALNTLIENNESDLAQLTATIVWNIRDKQPRETERLTPLIIKAADNTDSVIRNEAAFCLSYIETEESLKKLLELLDDSENIIRMKAATGLGKLVGISGTYKKDDATIERVTTALTTQFNKENEHEVKLSIIDALGAVGGEKAIEFLSGIKEKEGNELSGKADGAIRHSLENQVHVLRKELEANREDSNEASGNRFIAVQKLAKVKCDNAVKLLVECLNDPVPVIREHAVYSLGKQEANDTLINIVNSTKYDHDLKRAAVHALGNNQCTAAFNSLFEYVDEVRRAKLDATQYERQITTLAYAFSNILPAVRDSSSYVENKWEGEELKDVLLEQLEQAGSSYCSKCQPHIEQIRDTVFVTDEEKADYKEELKERLIEADYAIQLSNKSTIPFLDRALNKSGSLKAFIRILGEPQIKEIALLMKRAGYKKEAECLTDSLINNRAVRDKDKRALIDLVSNLLIESLQDEISEITSDEREKEEVEEILSLTPNPDDVDETARQRREAEEAEQNRRTLQELEEEVEMKRQERERILKGEEETEEAPEDITEHVEDVFGPKLHRRDEDEDEHDYQDDQIDDPNPYSPYHPSHDDNQESLPYNPFDDSSSNDYGSQPEDPYHSDPPSDDGDGYFS